MQTQWQWIKQLCLCVEQHVKENAAYFQVLEKGSPNFPGRPPLRPAAPASYAAAPFWGRGKEGWVVLLGAAFS